MVLARTSISQRDRIRNPRDYDWHSMVNMHRTGVVGKICNVHLMNLSCDIDILARTVIDRGHSFIIEGCFLDLDSDKDSGNWYKVQITFIKASDTADIVFTPCLFFESAFPDSEKYVDYRRKSMTPSA